jgi:outer membrane protein assembly factor BamB
LRLRHVCVIVVGLMTSACAAQAPGPRVDPFPLRFPLVEAGTLEIGGRVAGQPWAKDGVVYVPMSDGSLTAVVVPSRSVLWRHAASGSPDEAAGPAGRENLAEPTLRIGGSRLEAFDGQGGKLWEFEAGGAIPATPALSGGRVYFGASNRMFTCLDAATGKVKWRRRLQGAPVHPAVVAGGTVVVAASNSVIYFLSARGGSILSWETVPSRVVYPPVAAGLLVLVSSASRDVAALDIKTQKRVGQYQAGGPLVSGAVWSPPYIVLFVEDTETGRHRLVFLRSR